MSKYTALDDELHDYLVAHGARRDEALLAVERATRELGDAAVMQAAPDQAALIELLVRAIGAERALEVGTFTGYTAIRIARGLAPGGRLVTLELDPERARMARAHLERAGVGERVEIVVGPAARSLAELPADPPFDFAFVDADKTGYPEYYELVLERLRPGGLVMLDNVLLSGRVLDPAQDDEGARVMAKLNREIEADERVDLAMVGVADGITIARKR